MDKLFAGAAKVAITTERREVVNDDLYARVLVLKNSAETVVVTALDAVAIGGIEEIPDDFRDRYRQELAAKYGIRASNVLLSASHTHTAPPMLCAIPELLDRLVKAVGEASAQAVEVAVGGASGKEDTITLNRTLRMKDGSGWTMRQAHPLPPEKEVEAIGPTDPEVGIIKFEAVADHCTVAVVFNFACHPLIGTPSGKVTANYPGVAAQLIEESLGFGAVALFLQGAAGNINEIAYKDYRYPYHMEYNGMRLAFAVLRELPKVQTSPNARLAMLRKKVVFPRRQDIPGRIQKLLAEREKLLDEFRYNALDFKTFLPLLCQYLIDPEHPDDPSYRYLDAERRGDTRYRDLDARNRQLLATYQENLARMEKLSKLADDIATSRRHLKINEDSGEITIDGEVSGLVIGDNIILGMPVEPLVEVGLELKEKSPFRHTLIAGFSDGYMHYGPVPLYYSMGSYDTTECFLAPEWLDVCRAALTKILTDLKSPTE